MHHVCVSLHAITYGTHTTGRLHDVSATSDDAISLVSHAAEERLKNILSKLAVISQHRTDVLKVSI